MRRVLFRLLVSGLAIILVPAVSYGNTADLSQLLSEFESHILFAAQTDDWSSQRDAWVARVEQATSISQFRAALNDLEASILYDAQTDGWYDRRSGWVDDLNNAATNDQLAALLIEFETSVLGEAVDDSWRDRRAGWLDDVTTASSGYLTSTPAGASGGGSVNQLAQLLSEFESHILFAAQTGDWSGQRDAWVERVEQATSVSQFRAALSDLEASILYDAQTDGWYDRRSGWLDELNGAASTEQLAALLTEFETAILWKATDDAWPDRRGDWLDDVDAAGGGGDGGADYADYGYPGTPSSSGSGMSLSRDLYGIDNSGNMVASSNPVTSELTAGDERFSDGSVGDWYYYNAAAGEQVIITMNSPILDTIIFIYDEDGNVIAKDDDSGEGYNARLEFTFPADGYYPLLATTTVPGAPNRPNEEIYGTYELAVQTDYAYGGRDGAPTGQASAGSQATVGDWVTGRLEAGDDVYEDGSYIDVYTFSGNAGDAVSIELVSTDFDPVLFLTGPNDYRETNDDADGRNSRISTTLPASGTYQVIANSYETGQSGTYQLLIEAGGTAATPSFSGTSSGELTVGSTVNGTLSAGDETIDDGSYADVYTVHGQAGQTITARLESTAFDPYLFVRGPNDFSDQNDDAGENDRNAQLEFSFPVSGEYRFIVNSYAAGQTGAYHFSIASGGAGDYPQATGSSQLYPGTPVSGTLGSSDGQLESGEYCDIYTLNAGTGQEFAIDLTSADFDPYLIIRGPYDFSEHNDDYNEDRTRSRIEFSAPAAGEYRIYVTSYMAGEAGAYRLQVSDPGTERATGASSVSSTVGGDGRLTRGQAVNGRLNASSSSLSSGEYCDIYTFTGQQGERIVLEMNSSELDPYLCLRGPEVEEDNDDLAEGNRNARLVATLPQAGAYEVYATTYSPAQAGSYQIKLSSSGSVATGAPRPPDYNYTQPVAGGVQVYGVFVGISDYPGSDNDLDQCADDARKFAEALRRSGVATSSSQRVLLDSRATRSQVRAALQSMAGQVGPNDLFIFFYSGHGSQSGDLANSRERDRREESICMYDGNIGDDEIGELLARIHGRVTVVGLDSCFSGGFRDALTRPEQMGLFSSEEDLTSAVPDKFQAGGYLSHFLYRGMLGDCDSNQDRQITAGELTEYLYRQYAAEVTGVGSETMEGSRSYQHLVVDRGGVKVSDVLITLPRNTGSYR